MPQIQTKRRTNSRPRYTNVIKGKYWRFRHPLTGNLPLPGSPGDPQFHRRYAELLEQVGKVPTINLAGDSSARLSWLASAYEKSPEFQQLREATRRDYTRHLGTIIKIAGDVQYATIGREGAIALRNRFADQPRKANYVLQVLSLLLTWAVDQGLLQENKVLGTKKLKLNGKGYKPWSEPEIAAFLAGAKAPIALGVMLALYTGQRLGDIVTMTRERYRDGEIEVRQQKTSELLPLVCSESLQKVLDTRLFPDAPTLLVDQKGKPYPSKGAFSNALKREVRRLKLGEEISFHGLRYAAAARLEEAGATLSTIQAVTGHRTYQMASQYASKRRGAADAARLFDDSDRERN